MGGVQLFNRGRVEGFNWTWSNEETTAIVITSRPFEEAIKQGFGSKNPLSYLAIMGKKKVLDQVRDMIRLKHYSIRTEETYVNWIRRFILFHNKRHPKDIRRSDPKEVSKGSHCSLISLDPGAYWSGWEVQWNEHPSPARGYLSLPVSWSLMRLNSSSFPLTSDHLSISSRSILFAWAPNMACSKHCRSSQW